MIILDTLDKLDAYLDGLMRRTSHTHAKPIKPLVQMLFTAMWSQRAAPVSVREYKGLPANLAHWQSARTNRVYTVLHRAGEVLVRHNNVTVQTLDANTPLSAVPDIVAQL